MKSDMLFILWKTTKYTADAWSQTQQCYIIDDSNS